MSPRAFWRITPRKLCALAAIHSELNSVDNEKDKPEKKYIDEVF